MFQNLWTRASPGAGDWSTIIFFLSPTRNPTEPSIPLLTLSGAGVERRNKLRPILVSVEHNKVNTPFSPVVYSLRLVSLPSQIPERNISFFLQNKKDIKTLKKTNNTTSLLPSQKKSASASPQPADFCPPSLPLLFSLSLCFSPYIFTPTSTPPRRHAPAPASARSGSATPHRRGGNVRFYVSRL